MPSLLLSLSLSLFLSFCHYTVSLGAVLLSLFLLFITLSFFLPFREQAGRGQGESPRAAGGLLEGAAGGERERTVYNIVMIQQGRTRSMKRHHHHHQGQVFPFLFLFAGQAGRGQGESPQAAGGLFEGAADGERERTV